MFLSSGKKTISAADLNFRSIKNEHLLLFKDILLGVIRSEGRVSFNEFVDLVIANSLLPNIEEAFSFISKFNQDASAKLRSSSPGVTCSPRSNSPLLHSSNTTKLYESLLLKSRKDEPMRKNYSFGKHADQWS